MKKLNKKGFTLIELIVVIAILAILAAILIPSVTGYITKATDAKNQANCRSYYAQISLQVLLDEALSPADGAVVNDLTLDYTADTTTNVLSAFSCTPSTGTTAEIVLR
jgi:prepilin-type N-terminal cleavage/methylation domain-containing protein